MIAAARMCPHELFEVPLGEPEQLSEIELAAIRAGIPLPCWSDVDGRR